MKQSLVVNLFGGPNVGKSTMAHDIFSRLKDYPLVRELVPEAAKDWVWEKNELRLSNQVYLLGEQFHGIYRLLGQTDIIIVDSPILLNLIYKKDWVPLSFNAFVLDLFNSCNNINFLIEREDFGQFEQEGRIHNQDQSIEKDREILDLLVNNNVPFTSIRPGQAPIQEIIGKSGSKTPSFD
jgi:hypothetical protein